MTERNKDGPLPSLVALRIKGICDKKPRNIFCKKIIYNK